MSVCVAVTDSAEGQAALEAAASEAVRLTVPLVAVNLPASELDTSAVSSSELWCASARVTLTSPPSAGG
jgi:hypothetical protein